MKHGHVLAVGLALGVGLAGGPTLNAYASAPSAGSTAVDSAAAANAVSGAAIVSTALKYVGYPYTTVGNSPAKGFSCIGFVSYVYGANGIPLPDDLWMAQAYAPAVPFSSLLPGDILFFQNTVWTGLSHTAIYLGNGRFVHAEWYNRGVVTSSFYDDPVDGNYWIGKYLGANRPWNGPAGTPSVPAAAPTVSGPGMAPTATAAGGTAAVVAVAALNVRAAPSKSSEVLQVIAQGAHVSVLARQDGWYHIQMPDGTSGWVVTVGLSTTAAVPTVSAPPNLVTTKPASAPVQQAQPAVPPLWSAGTAQLKIPWLHVRGGPSLSASVIAVIVEGDRVSVLGRSGTWDEIRLQNGTVGWVSAPLLGYTFPKVVAGTVTAPVRVHNAPTLQAPVLTVAAAGTRVQILVKHGKWAQVQLRTGTTGYVWSTYVTP